MSDIEPTIKPPLKHPLDWREQKKTGYPTFCLAIAQAWHARNIVGDYVGVVVDPLGNETTSMTEQDYDAMISSAQELFKATKDRVAALPLPIPAKHVRILVHPDAHHAVIVKMPHGGDAMTLISEQRNAQDGQELQVKTFSFSSRLLWPVDASPEKQDLIDNFGLAFHMIYPDDFLKLAGWRGSEVKKRA